MEDRTHHEIRGVWTRGTDPKELVLSDGSRLALESGLTGDGEVAWKRTDGRDATEGPVSVPEAIELAGEKYEISIENEAAWPVGYGISVQHDTNQYRTVNYTIDDIPVWYHVYCDGRRRPCEGYVYRMFGSIPYYVSVSKLDTPVDPSVCTQD